MEWSRTHGYEHAAFAEREWLERDLTVSVCLPAREESATIAAIVAELITLCDRGVIDEVVVLDGASRDGTATLAEQAGAIVYRQATIVQGAGLPTPVELELRWLLESDGHAARR